MKPRDGREMTLKFLFSSEFKNSEASTSHELLSKLALFRKSFKASDDVWDFVFKVIKNFEAHSEEIDSKIKDQLKNWKIERLSFTDKNILRLAVTEMLYLNLNPKIAINEAVELSKKYSNLESGAFINGVLDCIAKEDISDKG